MVLNTALINLIECNIRRIRIYSRSSFRTLGAFARKWRSKSPQRWSYLPAVFIKDRPPVYLSEDEIILINEYAKLRTNIKNANNKTHLIISSNSAMIYEDKPVNNR